MVKRRECFTVEGGGREGDQRGGKSYMYTKAKHLSAYT